MATDAEKRQYLATQVSADLTYILEEVKLPLDVQYNLGQTYTTIALFAAIADTKPNARDAFRQDLAIDPTASVANRARLAALVTAWQMAYDVAEKERAVKAEARVMGLPKPLLQSERMTMRTALETAVGRLEEQHEPAPEYIAMKLEEVESGELLASPMEEIASVKDNQSSQLQSTLDSTGRLRITKERKKVKVPSNSEELRQKLKVECHTMLMLGARLRNKIWFQNLEQRHFSQYADFLLGDKVFQLQVTKTDGTFGTVAANPSWALILQFEHRLRKEAYKKVSRDNVPIAEALTTVLSDASLKETYFVTPLTLEFSRLASSRFSSPSAPYRSEPYPAVANPSKGKKGKGKGKAKRSYLGAPSAKGFVYSTTPDGRQICYAYNTKKCDNKCNRVHVCQMCLGPHPRTECPTSNKQDDVNAH